MKNKIVLMDLKRPYFAADVPEGLDMFWFMNEHQRIMSSIGFPTAPYLKSVKVRNEEDE